MIPLTKRELDALIYIRDYIKKNIIAPSYEEIKKELGLKSKSNVFIFIHSLNEKGYIEHFPKRSRGISIKQLPQQMNENI